MAKKIFTKNNIIKIAVIIGVVIIPLMYSFFYLSAFWDPYSKLENLPVAVVNNDAGAEINSEQRNLGNEFCDKLKEDGSFKFSFTDEDDAKKGTEDKKYYAMIKIPENFSKCIASADEKDKQTAEIIFSANEKRNYLAGQILSRAVLEMEKGLRESITKEMVDTLADQVNGMPGKLDELSDGLGELSDGTSKLSDGANSLKDGTSQLSAGIGELKKGMDSLQSGSQTASTSAQALASGASTLNNGINSYVSGVNSLISSVNETSSFISAYVKAHPELLSDPQFAAFIQKLSNPQNAAAVSSLQSAGTQLSAASSQLSDGASKLAAGAKSLEQGIKTANGGAAKLESASGQIASGAQSLSSGTAELDKAVKTAKEKLDSSVEDSKKQLEAIDGLGDFVSKSVEIKSEPINPIDNYGTYFSPYFMSLSLWVGALIIFFGIYFDVDGRFSFLSRTSSHKIARSFAYLLISFAQAILLGIVLTCCLGLEPKHIGMYFISLCLVSLVSISIVQFCIVHLGNLGKFLAIALLILQLTSCGGTFPMETVPKFFNALYPFMPMTYAVSVFKETISGDINSGYWQNTMILVIILVVFVAATDILSKFKKEKNAAAA